MRNWILVLALVGLAGCSWVAPYKLDVQQGIVIEPEALAQLKEGMSQAQVSFLLGTPLLRDPFHADRWDYVTYERKHGSLDKPLHVTLVFKEQKLVRILSDYPAPVEPPASPAPAAK